MLSIRFLEPSSKDETDREWFCVHLAELCDHVGGKDNRAGLMILTAQWFWFIWVPIDVRIYVVKQGVWFITLNILLHEIGHLILRLIYGVGSVGAVVNRWHDGIHDFVAGFWISYMPVKKNGGLVK